MILYMIYVCNFMLIHFNRGVLCFIFQVVFGIYSKAHNVFLLVLTVYFSLYLPGHYTVLFSILCSQLVFPMVIGA